MVSYLIFAISYSFACVVQPGPFQAYLFSQSLTNGWRKTIPLVVAPLISDIPVIVLVLFVLTNIPGMVLGILQCLGGIFLVYLAYKAYQSWRKLTGSRERTDRNGSFFKAIIVNLLNPNPYLGWSLVMGPMLLKGWSVSPVTGIVFLAGFYMSMFFYSIVMVVLFSAAGNLGSRISKVFVGISVIAFLLFGVYEFWSGVSGLAR